MMSTHSHFAICADLGESSVGYHPPPPKLSGVIDDHTLPSFGGMHGDVHMSGTFRPRQVDPVNLSNLNRRHTQRE
jgi:hypothetical protein